MYKISIGISALNEEQNIKKLLNSVLTQNLGEHELLEIIVISDGSTDKTVEEINSIKSNKIKVFEYTERAGKMQRFNEIFKASQGDILITIDADVLPESNDTFKYLIDKFNEDNVQYVSGRSKPIEPRNFLEKSINISRRAWDVFRDTLKSGNGVYACNGKFFGISHKLAQQIVYPLKGSGDQGYVYFFCLSKGYEFRGCKDAKVLFRSPNSLKEHIKQINWYQKDYYGWKDEFGPIVKEEYKIPAKMLIKEKLRLFAKYPIHTVFLFVVNFYAKHIYKPKIANDQKWDMQTSTKEAF